MQKIKIELCPSPDLISIYKGDSKFSAIVVDILRATTTICTAVNNGADGILAVSSTEEAIDIGKKNNYLIAAERNVRKCDFADLGNDPSEYKKELISDRKIVMTTTNGTRSIELSKSNGADDVIIGSFLNISSTSKYIIKKGIDRLLIVAAGWNGQASLEDCLYAGAIAYKLQKLGVNIEMNDMTLAMYHLYESNCLEHHKAVYFISKTEHYQRLLKNNMESTTNYAMTEDIIDIVVGLDRDRFIRCIN